jgi:hypothetical protein
MCLLWCLWGEMNAQNFGDIKTSMTELWKIVFNTLHNWIAAHHSLLVSNFADFLNSCSSFSFV